MGEEIACSGFSVLGQYDFPCGAAGRFCIGEMPDFHLLQTRKGAVIGSKWSGGGALFSSIESQSISAYFGLFLVKDSNSDIMISM